jgi:GNAT superfamily N-acetyltransferase
LKRESAGVYRSDDGRFTVEKSSGGWMVVDAEQHDDLGLPLARGPFATLDDAREASEEARAEPAPRSDIATRAAGLARHPRDAPPGGRRRTSSTRRAEPRNGPPPIEIRAFRSGDGERLRALWDACDMHSVGDDDESLATMARRNPGTVMVAVAGGEIVASALGGWDGRRGWIYHVAVAPDRRRSGLGRRLVERIEAKLRELGAPKVNVMVEDDNPDGAAFWRELGYVLHDSSQYGKVFDQPT